jgi:hypothetical protein
VAGNVLATLRSAVCSRILCNCRIVQICVTGFVQVTGVQVCDRMCASHGSARNLSCDFSICQFLANKWCICLCKTRSSAMCNALPLCDQGTYIKHEIFYRHYLNNLCERYLCIGSSFGLYRNLPYFASTKQQVIAIHLVIIWTHV